MCALLPNGLECPQELIMKTRPIAALLALAALGTTPGLPAQNKRALDSAGQMFRQRCATCHTVPDPSIRTDLAWLDQLNRTA